MSGNEMGLVEPEGQTLLDKVWESHEVIPPEQEGGASLIYINLHLIHEVTSPQAFESLRLAGRSVRRPDLTLATADHNVPTDGTPTSLLIEDFFSRQQVSTLESNCEQNGITLYSVGDKRQGIVHVISPELGTTLPGTTIVCGDSHTSTHGAFGAFAIGIGSSEVEHVLATQCLYQTKPNNLRVNYENELARYVTPKDLILATIGRVGTDGFNGHAVEYAGRPIQNMSMEGRMTICNMTIEGGGRAGMIAPDYTTYSYLEGRPGVPVDFGSAVEYWRSLRSDSGARFDKEVSIDASDISPMVTWGTNPGMVVQVTGAVPRPQSTAEQHALDYMGLSPDTPITDISLDRVFIGSCTNARIEDLRAAAKMVLGKQVASTIDAMVVPGSRMVQAQAEEEGLDEIFKGAGFDWRSAGCSMCLGMNPDILKAGERCASTSNRNFQGRQGPGGRTHLVSPQMAAAAAIEGKFVDIREWD